MDVGTLVRIEYTPKTQLTWTPSLPPSPPARCSRKWADGSHCCVRHHYNCNTSPNGINQGVLSRASLLRILHQ